MCWPLSVYTTLISTFKAKIHTIPSNTHTYLMCNHVFNWDVGVLIVYFPSIRQLKFYGTQVALVSLLGSNGIYREFFLSKYKNALLVTPGPQP